MKSEQRHQLQQNELAVRLAAAVEWCQHHAPLLLGILVGLGVTIAAITYFSGRSEQNQLEAWSNFFDAAGRGDSMKLETIGNRGDDLPSQFANIVLGDAALRAGIEQMSTNRIEADGKLNEAKNRYSDVRKDADDPLLQQRATYGLARYYETVGMLPEAIKEYQQLADRPDGLFTKVANDKIAYLQEPNVQKFSEWYKNFRPKSMDAVTPGMPTAGDLGNLPTDESSFPPPTASGTAAPSPTGTAAAPTASATAAPPAVPAPTPSATPAK